MWERRNLTGMPQVGINASSDLRKKLTKVSRLAPDFVIAKEGERPQVGYAVAMLTAGIPMLMVPILIIVATRFPNSAEGDECAQPVRVERVERILAAKVGTVRAEIVLRECLNPSGTEGGGEWSKELGQPVAVQHGGKRGASAAQSGPAEPDYK